MENGNITQPAETKPPVATEKIIFHGKGKDLFGIMLLNVILSLLTLGIYYPWAKASYLKFTYSETEFKGSRFSFHGSGKEMFMGMLKAVIVLAIIFGVAAWSFYIQKPWLAYLIYIPALIFLYPLAIVGSLKYRTSRSSWRGIHFGYRGTYKSMMKVNAEGLILTILTFGIYYSWYLTSLYKEMLSNVRLGSIKFSYQGNGGDYFATFIKGYFLTLLTLGIYFFKWQSDIHNYILSNVTVMHGENKLKGKLIPSTTGWGLCKLHVGNLLLLIVSLGIAAPWTAVRTLKYYTDALEVKSRIQFETITQTETDFADASGEGFADALDLQLI